MLNYSVGQLFILRNDYLYMQRFCISLHVSTVRRWYKIELITNDSHLVSFQLKQRPFWLATDISALQQQHEQLQHESPKLGSNQGGPNQGGPNQGGPNQAGPNQGGPNWTGPNRTGPNHPPPPPPQATTQTVTNKFNTHSSSGASAGAGASSVLLKTNNFPQQQPQQPQQPQQRQQQSQPQPQQRQPQQRHPQQDVVQTVKVADTTALSHSFTSILSNLNKSVNTAFNSILSFQQPDMAAGFRSPQPQPHQQHHHQALSAVPKSGVDYPPGGQRFGPAFARSPGESRSPSPGFGFSAAVSNICDQAHSIAERDRHTNPMARRGK